MPCGNMTFAPADSGRHCLGQVTMASIHYLQHVPFERLGSIADWANERGHTVSVTRLYADEPLPAHDAFDWLIVMGGPMGVHDDDTVPWLVREKRFIEQAIGQGKTVLGICLGAQIIAHVLGAKVYKNQHKEIGWFPIRRLPQAGRTAIGQILPEQVEVFHWHGDTFDLPPGAVHLARSEACENQAFVYQDRVLSLQFHLETTLAGARDLVTHCRQELLAGPYIQQPEVMLGNNSRFATINTLMHQVLDTLARLDTQVS